jgi:hypothetical protein
MPTPNLSVSRVRHKLLLAATAAALPLLTTVAHAEMRDTVTFGSWTTAAGISNNNRPMCSARISGAVRSFFIKYEKGFDGVFLQLFKDGWHIPAGQPIDVVLQVDQAMAWRLPGTGMQVPGLPFSGINISIPANSVSTITGKNTIEVIASLLREGLSVKFFFPEGSEPPWEGPLDGSSTALSVMAGCVSAITAAPQPTQPVPAAQPFRLL